MAFWNKDVMDAAARRHNPVYLEVLETLTRAWSEGRMVQLWHRRPDGKVFEYEAVIAIIWPTAGALTTTTAS